MKMMKFILAQFAGLVLLAGSALANDPGGGTNGVGANVTLTVGSSTVTLANGRITAVIEKTTGKVTSYLFNGTQMLDTSGLIYFSMDGGSSYEQPDNCVYATTVNTADTVDISCKVTWANNTNRLHAFDIDIHYVLRRGDSGLYAYAVLSHPASYPAAGVGEWRMVWKLPHSSTQWSFERVYVDALRNWNWGTYSDFLNADATEIAEVVKLTTGVRAGQYDCKYMYAAEYQQIGCWGHASDTNKKGVWMVLGGYDYLNDGPPHTDLTLAESYNLIHFGRNHYGGSSTSVGAGEAWSKIYGPYLLYCNTTTASANAGTALWADAKGQVQAELAAWPYAWLTYNTNYPPASGRGAVSGRLVVNDAFKPALTGSNAWVGLAQPDAGGNWQFESKRYQYWAHADSVGNFTIPHVRPGSYTLYAWIAGAVGEFSRSSVTVAAGGTNALGTLTWNVPHTGGYLAWEIGIPDRSAHEFRHGSTDYFEPFMWERFSSEFSNPLEYTVGASNWSNDWNYAHCGYLAGTNWNGWKWRVNFNLASVPASGNATLTLAWAGNDHARMQIFVNNESSQFGANLYPPNGGGNGLIREGIHAKYGVSTIAIPVSRLRAGTNTLTLLQGRSTTASDHVMYDYVSLEMPGPPPVPGPITVPLISTGAVWRYCDSGTNLGTVWRDAAFDDSAWPGGEAQLGFGDGDENTIIASNRQITTYFRREFLAGGPATFTNLTLRLLRDDGGVAYLNGVEVFRSNLATGAVNHLTTASNALAGDETTNFYSASLNPALLLSGTNLLAVEIHQQSATSSDLSFDLALTGLAPSGTPMFAVTNDIGATDTTPVSARLHGALTMLNAAPADVTIFWGQSDGDTNELSWSDSTTLPARELGRFFADVTGLEPGTNYFYRCRAANPFGEAWAATSASFATPPPVPVALISPGAAWKYSDQTNDLGAAWRSNSFNDVSWSSGPAMLGFGDANGLFPATVIASNRQWTTYFRRQFYVPDASQVFSLDARILRDDGAIVYLNGVEIWRDTNMPSGVITNQTPARSALGGSSETNWLSPNLSPSALSLLSAGWNLLAIEVHQNALNSSDVALNFELTGTALVSTTIPLNVTRGSNALTLSWPADAAFCNLYTVTNLAPPTTWQPATNERVWQNNQWWITVPINKNGQVFFRLQAP
jgi:rhamnogalacturonan endolyase